MRKVIAMVADLAIKQRVHFTQIRRIQVMLIAVLAMFQAVIHLTLPVHQLSMVLQTRYNLRHCSWYHKLKFNLWYKRYCRWLNCTTIAIYATTARGGELNYFFRYYLRFVCHTAFHLLRRCNQCKSAGKRLSFGIGSKAYLTSNFISPPYTLEFYLGYQRYCGRLYGIRFSINSIAVACVKMDRPIKSMFTRYISNRIIISTVWKRAIAIPRFPL